MSGKKKPTMTTRVRRGGMRTALDEKGSGYARLLMDPCNAPLVHPVYPGGEAGFLFRAESFITWGTSAGTTSGVVHWTPGYVNSSGTMMITCDSVNGTTSQTMTAANPLTITPGQAFLASNARGARCVAACVKLIYPGSESTRAGRVHYGLTQGGMLDVGNTTTVDQVAQTLQHFSRTPTEPIEIVWKPNIADTEFNDPAEVSNQQIRDRKSAITFAFVGLPATVGMTAHFTAVYEWTPAVGQGVAHNALGKNTSRNTLDQVLDTLIQGGFQFVKHAGGAAGGMLGQALVSGVSQIFGQMPTTPGRLRLNF